MGGCGSKASTVDTARAPARKTDGVDSSFPTTTDDGSSSKISKRVSEYDTCGVEEWENFLITLPVCPIHGCTHAFLAEFEKGGSHGEPSHSLTGDDFNIGSLTVQVIKPFTTIRTGEEVEYLSYAELAFRTGQLDTRGRPAFDKEATHFISHAWKYRFSLLVSALRNWIDSNDVVEDDQYFWVDAFVVNQHQAQEYPMEWWSTRFAAAVGEVGSTIMIAEPWEDPLPLKRVWVIWELYCTNQTGARLSLAMTKETESNFKHALTNSFETVQTVLSSVDVSTCTAYHAAHTDMVHTEIKRTIGFAKLNEMVSLRLTQWLIETGTIQLNLIKKVVDPTDTAAILDAFKLQDNLARMIRESGSPAVAETSYKELIPTMEARLGRDDDTTMQCLNQLAVTLQKVKKGQEALSVHQECYKRRKNKLGPEHEDTLQSVSNLAVLLSEKRPMTTVAFQEARNYYSTAVDGRQATIGADHPRTLYTVSNAAKLLSDAPDRFDNKEGLFREAEVMHDRAASKLIGVLTQGHPLTLGAMHNQACHWVDWYVHSSDAADGNSEMLDKAISQLKRVHSLRIQKLGDTHTDTVDTEKKLQKALGRKQNSRFYQEDESASWKTLVRRRYERLNTGPLFKKLRNELRSFGPEKLKMELVIDGYVDPRSGSLTVGTQPFNIFARLSAGVQVQRKVPEEQSKLGPFADRYVIAHNKPECKEMWQRDDPTWLGKASMSKNHVFLLSKSLKWITFNILTMGLYGDKDTTEAIEKLEDMREAAYYWVSHQKDWPSVVSLDDWPEMHRIGLFVSVFPFTSIPAFHLHIVDLDKVGPSFEKASFKMLPLDAAIQVLKDERQVPLPVSCFLDALKRCGPVTELPGKDGNQELLGMLDEHLPELQLYKEGKVKTSPGVIEIEGSPTEYYRTVGAILAFLGAYATSQGDPFGCEIATAGKRGPMSMDQIPGKFINMGTKPEAYEKFCMRFAETMKDERDWWSMLVFLAVHDVGKSVKFCARVNSTLPIESQTDDHDRILACCLSDVHLTAELLPSVYKLPGDRHAKLLAGFATNFQLPQLGQGEVTVGSLQGLLELPESHLHNGTLRNYLYHSIFDIAGGPCNERFLYPLALVPVYMGFTSAMEELCVTLAKGEAIKTHQLYTDFLLTNFRKTFPDFDKDVFMPLCATDRSFLKVTGLVMLRILALTRNTYTNVEKLLELLQSGTVDLLIREMSGTAGSPQIMLYYAPDLLRMGLGDDMKDESGENMRHALMALEVLFRLVRVEVEQPGVPELEQYDLNVYPLVEIVKKFGKSWRGGVHLLETSKAVKVTTFEHFTEGILDVGDAYIVEV